MAPRLVSRRGYAPAVRALSDAPSPKQRTNPDLNRPWRNLAVRDEPSSYIRASGSALPYQREQRTHRRRVGRHRARALSTIRGSGGQDGASSPGIAFRGTESDRRAWVPGTALDGWEIVAGYEEMGRERVLEESSISWPKMNHRT